MKAFIIALLLSTPAMAQDYKANTSVELNGTTYYSDGSSSFEMGGVTYDSSGAACTDYGCEVE